MPMVRSMASILTVAAAYTTGSSESPPPSNLNGAYELTPTPNGAKSQPKFASSFAGETDQSDVERRPTFVNVHLSVHRNAQLS